MEPINKGQLAKLHVLLTRLGWLNEKKEIVSLATCGRTESSRELYYDEAKCLLQQLSEYDPSERLKSLIFSLAYRANIIYGSSKGDKLINAAKLNLFLKERGAVKKELNDMSYPELVKTHKQFEAMVKNIAKAIDNKEASAAVKSLLNELNFKALAR